MRNLRWTTTVGMLFALWGAGCLLLEGEFEGQPCGDDTQCPDYYRCVQLGPTQSKTCEVNFPSKYQPPVVDAGTRDAGRVVTPFYCNEVKPLLDMYCTANCHGADTTGSLNDTFRLDYYTPPAGGKGAFAMASRIKIRTTDLATMPPAVDLMGNPVPMIPDAGRLVLSNWVLAGAPFCNTGTDAGTSGGMDSGTPVVDSGTPDAGTPPVAFSAVQAILDARCNAACHNAGNQTGNLILTGNARAALVNVATNGASCVGGGRMRVVPNNPTASQLWLKISNNGAKCGNAMPNQGVGGTGLISMQAAEAQTILNWINSGAGN